MQGVTVRWSAPCPACGSRYFIPLTEDRQLCIACVFQRVSANGRLRITLNGRTWTMTRVGGAVDITRLDDGNTAQQSA